MSETYFPVNDLLRRKLQTSLAIGSLTCSVASTLFLLLFSSRLGLGLTSASERTLTVGLSAVFYQLILFIGMLIFIVGSILTSFIVFLLMTQRTRDFGLIKAAGCPNGLVWGYYMMELLIVTSAGCVLGVVTGIGVDFAISKFSSFVVFQQPANLWFAPLVFAVFFFLALVFGTKPILKASRLPAIKALSSVQYFGLNMKIKPKPFSASMLTGKIAFRSLSRRPTASIRIAILLSVVFVLLTVSIAGSIIAKDTTTSWVERTAEKNVFAVANSKIAARFELLESRFFGIANNDNTFDYLSEELAILNETIQQLRTLPGIVKVDARTILEEHVYEVANFTIDPETMRTLPVGDKREGDFLVIGVEPEELSGSWFIQGRFLKNSDNWEAVIGDSVARKMFSEPLVQSLRLQNLSFSIVGVCIDPIDNGNVIYVPLRKLQQIAGVSAPNIVFLEFDSSVNRAAALEQITGGTSSVNQDLVVIYPDKILGMSLAFLGSSWSTVLLLPLFTLVSATLCLIAYMMLSVDEQSQEFAILRAIGAKPKTIVAIVAIQSGIVLASSLALGLSFGIITTLLILVPQPVVNSFTILQIALWLVFAVFGMFFLSLAPAVKLARSPLLRIIA